MFIRLGQPFDINALQVIGDVQYPPGWFFNAENRAAQGVTEVADPPAPPVVPQTVARRRALQALRLAGITSTQVESALASALSGMQLDLALIEFRESLEFDRNRPLVNSLGPLLGLTATQIDNLFITAGALP